MYGVDANIHAVANDGGALRRDEGIMHTVCCFKVKAFRFACERKVDARSSRGIHMVDVWLSIS